MCPSKREESILPKGGNLSHLGAMPHPHVPPEHPKTANVHSRCSRIALGEMSSSTPPNALPGNPNVIIILRESSSKEGPHELHDHAAVGGSLEMLRGAEVVGNNISKTKTSAVSPRDTNNRDVWVAWELVYYLLDRPLVLARGLQAKWPRASKARDTTYTRAPQRQP